MAFTQAQLQTSLNTAVSGNNCTIIRFDATSDPTNYTDVTVQNLNSSAQKTATKQVAQSNTADQAAAAILLAMS